MTRVRSIRLALALTVGLVSTIGLAGCSVGATPAAPSSATLASAPETAAQLRETASGGAVSSPASEPSTPAVSTPDASPTSSPGPRPPVDGVTIIYEEGSQFELWSPAGQRVFIDVYSPGAITSRPTALDVLLTTHRHDDHYSDEFLRDFPGRTLTWKEGGLTASDVRIRSIAGAHNEGDPLLPADGSDYIFIVDVGGVRVVVFGDLGQKRLTRSQMAAIGSVDVAISQLQNDMSDMTVANRKAIGQITQVHPRILIPTHQTLDAAKMAAAEWPSAAADRFIVVTPANLPASTTICFMGDLAAAYRKLIPGIASTNPWP
jgi:L-ascorbate metabolism protein UlaG (beta-lactamase superfamily)